MRIISRRTLRDFWEDHADAGEALEAWLADVRAARWTSFNELKAQFPSASLLGNNRVCFNIKGNRYRLIAAVFVSTGVVMVKFVGTHAQYDRVDAETVEPY